MRHLRVVAVVNGYDLGHEPHKETEVRRAHVVPVDAALVVDVELELVQGSVTVVGVHDGVGLPRVLEAESVADLVGQYVRKEPLLPGGQDE